MRKGVSIFHNVHDIPKLDNTRTAILDLSDAGEVGYMFGYSPEDLVKLPVTAYEVIYVDTSCGGRSCPGEWEAMLNPKDNDCLVIFNCPKRGMLMNEMMSTDPKCKRISCLLNWLVNQAYENIYVLVSRAPTALNKMTVRF